MVIEIVDLPIKHGYVNVYQRVRINGDINKPSQPVTNVNWSSGDGSRRSRGSRPKDVPSHGITGNSPSVSLHCGLYLEIICIFISPLLINIYIYVCVCNLIYI